MLEVVGTVQKQCFLFLFSTCAIVTAQMWKTVPLPPVLPHLHRSRPVTLSDLCHFVARSKSSWGQLDIYFKRIAFIWGKMHYYYCHFHSKASGVFPKWVINVKFDLGIKNHFWGSNVKMSFLSGSPVLICC